MKKIESITSLKFKQLDKNTLKNIKGGDKEESVYSEDGGHHWYYDSFNWTKDTMDNFVKYPHLPAPSNW